MAPYTGLSIVDYLASVGHASDFNTRKSLAGQNGIQNYSGSAEQNTQLLNTLRTAGVKPAPAPAVVNTQPPVVPADQSAAPPAPVPAPVASPAPPAPAPAVAPAPAQTQTPAPVPTAAPGSNAAITSPDAAAGADSTGNQYYKVEVAGTGPDNKPLYDVYGPNGKLDQKQFQSAGLNIDHIPESLAPNLSGDFSNPGDAVLEKYGVTKIAPEQNPLTAFADTYQEVIKKLGLNDVKSQFDEVMKQQGDLQNELNDKIAEVNDNPWLAESVRQGKIKSLNDRYAGRLDTLTNQAKLYDSLYQQGRLEAEFVTKSAIDQQQFDQTQQEKILELQQKASEAAASLNKGTGTIQEYHLAQSEGYTGTFLDYQKKTANLKDTIGTNTASGISGVTGSAFVDPSVPGYTTKAVPGAGGLTQAAIDQAATQYATTGVMPSLGLGSTGAAGERRTAIQNRAGELNAGGTIAGNKAELASLTTSLNDQTEYLNTTQRSLSNAENGLQQLISNFKNSGINSSQSPLANKTFNSIKKSLSGGDIFAFNAGLQEVANEYQQVFSRGGQVSESVRKTSQDILNGNVSFNDLQRISNELQAQGKIVIQGAQVQVKQIGDQINGIVTGKATTVSPGNFKDSLNQDIQDLGSKLTREQLADELFKDYGKFGLTRDQIYNDYVLKQIPDKK